MKRKLSLLLSLMMVLTLIPMSSFAATSNRVSRVITTTSNGSTTEGLVPEFVIDNGDGDLIVNDAAELTLKEGAEWRNAVTTGTGFTLTRLSSRSARLNVDALQGEYRIPLVVDFDGAPEGNQEITLNTITGGFTSGTYTYATIGRSDITIRSEVKEKISRSGSQEVTFRIDETTVSSFVGAQDVTLRLPSGFSWNTVNANGSAVAPANIDGRNLTIDVSAYNTVAPARIDSIFVQATLTASRDARFGDIDVIATRGSVSPSSLIIAEYVDFVPAVRVERVLDVVSGRNQEGLYRARVIVEENVAGTFLRDRFIEFSFNRSEASLQHNQNLTIVSGGTDFSIDLDSSPSFRGVSGTGNSVTTTVVDGTNNYDADQWDVVVDTTTPSRRKLELEIPFVVSAGFEGDLELTVKGAGIEEQTVVIAKAKKPVTTEIIGGTTAELILGLQKQSTPDIIITETEAGSLEETLYSITSTGTYEINWDDAEIEVIEGNLELDEDATESVRKGINIVVDRRSTTPSKIKISGVQVTLDRTVPYGPFNVSMNFGRVKAQHDRLTNNVGSKAYFNVVTPVQDGQRLTAVFTIGDANYTVNGEAMTLDAAPFISNNRTMLPIGTIAQVVGASVNYSPVTRTAIFTKDGVVVSMTLDQPFLTANGVVIPMDSAPVVVNSRAFVPMAFVAQAFGVPVQYDAAERTVTVN